MKRDWDKLRIQAIQLRTEGMTLTSIAKQLSSSFAWVKKVLKKAGMAGEGAPLLTPGEKAQLTVLYAEKLSDAQMGNRIGRRTETVARWRRSLGLPPNYLAPWMLALGEGELFDRGSARAGQVREEAIRWGLPEDLPEKPCRLALVLVRHGPLTWAQMTAFFSNIHCYHSGKGSHLILMERGLALRVKRRSPLWPTDELLRRVANSPAVKEANATPDGRGPGNPPEAGPGGG